MMRRVRVLIALLLSAAALAAFVAAISFAARLGRSPAPRVGEAPPLVAAGPVSKAVPAQAARPAFRGEPVAQAVPPEKPEPPQPPPERPIEEELLEVGENPEAVFYTSRIREAIAEGNPPFAKELYRQMKELHPESVLLAEAEMLIEKSGKKRGR